MKPKRNKASFERAGLAGWLAGFAFCLLCFVSLGLAGVEEVANQTPRSKITLPK